jgi:hypothetical protein
MQLAFGPQGTPFIQMGRVQPFSAQQGADLAPLGATVRFFHDAQLVLGAELPA